MDEQAPVRSEDGDRHRAVAEVRGAHARARRDLDHPIVLVDDIDQFLAVRPSDPIPRSREKTYHAAMTVDTLREEAQDLHDETVRCAASSTSGRRSATSCP